MHGNCAPKIIFLMIISFRNQERKMHAKPKMPRKKTVEIWYPTAKGKIDTLQIPPLTRCIHN